jgi:hypothetical protein
MFFQTTFLTALNPCPPDVGPRTSDFGHFVPLDTRRAGAVLLIVLVILTIFATVGLAFMFYSQTEALSSSGFKDAQPFRGPEMDPDLAFAQFLQQMIFDCRDDTTGVASALRGHSLVRNMYGLNYTINPNGTIALLPNNNVPFNGTGRLHWTYTVPAGKFPADPKAILVGADDYNLVNYSYFPLDNFVRDPERLGPPRTLPLVSGSDNRWPFFGSANPPYTAADLNCMALAAVKADGTLLSPSYHRNYNGISLDFNDPGNTYMYWSQDKAGQPWLKYTTLRPRLADHPAWKDPVTGITKPGFPLPEDAGGDVRNRPVGWGGSVRPDTTPDPTNDSVWLYTGAPIMTLPDGRQYTTLYAPLIIDLDSKLNVNVAGNIRGVDSNKLPVHASNQGFGPWEMNIGNVLVASDATNKKEWVNLFIGTPVPHSNVLRVYARYGANPGPGAAANASATWPLNGNSANNTPHFYGQIDYDAVKNWSAASGGTLATSPWLVPANYQCWPKYQPGYENANAAELQQHPSLFNSTTAAPGYRNFGAGELNKIYRYGDTNSDAMLSDLWQLLPNNFNILPVRNMITTISFDRREVGMTPWLFNGQQATGGQSGLYQLTGYSPAGSPIVAGQPPPGSFVAPKGFPLSSPDPSLFVNFKANPVPGFVQNVGKEYGAKDGRGQPPISNIRASLNFNLPNYPAPVNNLITNLGAFNTAQNARATFASVLFKTLVKVTGAYDIFNYSATASPAMPAPDPQGGDRNALRYLAQIAVNIVDFIDTDDYITPFNWGIQGSADFKTAFGGTSTTTGSTIPWSSEWVYGTEIPKVVINEAYCEYVNDFAKDPKLAPGIPRKPQDLSHATYYYVDTWVELFNTFRPDPTLTDGGNPLLFNGSPTKGFPVYRLLMTNQNKNMHDPKNIDGRPDGQPLTGPINLTSANLTVAGAILGHVDNEFAANPVFNALPATPSSPFSAPTNNASNTGFYMIGPKLATGNVVPFPNQGSPASLPKATINAPGMRYKFVIPPPLQNPLPNNPVEPCPPAPTFMLQRLLCPYLRPNPNAADTTSPYNPYITVDYMEVPTPATPAAPTAYVGGMNQAATRNGFNASQAIPPNTIQTTTPPAQIVVQNRTSIGRAQPYQAKVQVAGQTVGGQPQAVPQPANQPQHTFFYHNWQSGVAMPPSTTAFSPNPVAGYPPFDWLVHLDRNLISPMELLHVSGYRPHELTQQFNGLMAAPPTPPTPPNVGTGHQAPWFDNSSRLYRFLEFVQTPPRQTGTTARIPGKINVNNIWDFPIFNALCDPQVGSHFTASDVNTIFFKQLVASRNPGGIRPGSPTPYPSGMPSPYDQPFLPLSAGVVPLNDPQYPNPAANPFNPNGLGIGNTLLRPFPSALNTAATQLTNPRVLEAPPLPTPPPPYPTNNQKPNHPYVRFELLNKIYNNVTVRSNCFAVWVTAGFFEVNNIDATGRIYLGQEIGRGEGRNVRHRMFAIVDRSVMDGATPTSAGLPFLPTLTPGGSSPTSSMTQEVLNMTIPFNPHSAAFKDVVPFFTVIE